MNDEALKTAQDAYGIVGKPVQRGKEKRTVQAVFARSGNVLVELVDKRGRMITVTLGEFNKLWKVV
jgi:hypothetical protein